MSDQNLKKIEKELESYAFGELAVQENMFCHPDSKYAFLFAVVVKKSAYLIDSLQSKYLTKEESMNYSKAVVTMKKTRDCR